MIALLFVRDLSLQRNIFWKEILVTMHELQTQGGIFSFVGHLTEELKFRNVLLLKIKILLKVL